MIDILGMNILWDIKNIIEFIKILILQPPGDLLLLVLIIIRAIINDISEYDKSIYELLIEITPRLNEISSFSNNK